MEGLNHKWTKSRITGLYHYFGSLKNGYSDSKLSICGSFKYFISSFAPRDFLDKFEILDQSKLCTKCKQILDVKSHNKKIIEDVKLLPIKNNHTSKYVTCSEPGCKEKGVTFVSTVYPEKDHYCMKHNLRVQQTIKKTKAIA